MATEEQMIENTSNAELTTEEHPSTDETTQKRRKVPKDREMQILDGKHKSKFLHRPASPKVRITPRTVKEKIFLLLGRRTRKSRFLDLYAGAGTVGIEAISRGALIGTFVERSARMASLIKENIEQVGISQGHGEVFEIEALPFLKRMAQRGRKWDIVFVNPTTETDYQEVLDFFQNGKCLRKEGGVIAIQHPIEMFFPEKYGALKRRRVILEGDMALTFYEHRTKEFQRRPYIPRREFDDSRERSYRPRREEGMERRDYRDARPPRRDYEPRPPRREGESSERPDYRDSRPPRRDYSERRDYDSRPPRRDYESRPPRREGETGERRTFEPRPPRRDYDARPPRRDYEPRPPRREGESSERGEYRESRPPRQDYGERRDSDVRPPRRDYEPRPPRRDYESRPPRREYGERPPRREYHNEDEGDRRPSGIIIRKPIIPKKD